jgi:glycosyltransferase involved in cell wall biosynthesis
MRCIKKRATAVLTNSQGLAEQLAFLLERCPEEIGVVPNGVLDDTFWQRASEPVVHPWLINKEHPVILGVGRLVRQKDWPTLIQAFALLREKISCRLILVGQGDMAERLKSLVWELNIASDVAFPGFVSNALPWMRDASVVALSSLHEGLPNVLIEAMVLGTPAVATDCPFGPAEIIAQLGNGQLVPIGDAVKMSEALLNVLLSPPIPPSPEQLKTYSAVRESRIIQSYLGLKRSLYEVSNDT